MRLPRTRVLIVVAVVAALLFGCSSTPPASTPSGNPQGSAAPGRTAATGSQTPGGSGSSPVAGSTQPPGTTAEPGSTPDPGSTPAPVASPTPEPSPVTPTPTPGSGQGAALPDCAYKDKPAVGDPDSDWATMLLDTIYRLPADFVPHTLVSTSKAGLQSGFEVIPAVVDDLQDLHEASQRADAEIAVRWAYRSYAEQQGAFAHWVRVSGEAAALKKSARPGHSEHQLGTAIDFRSADSLQAPWDYDDWATTEAGAWMGQHAWEYGFALSYPKGKEDVTCYGYEPWHFRYVGRDVAKKVHDTGETLREYLWELAASGH